MLVHITASARTEIISITDWYDRQPEQYGDEFLREFERATVAIGESPRLYSPAYDSRPGHEDREYFIARFEQRVIYTIVEEIAHVLTVAHATQREGRWHRRVRLDPPPETT